MLNSLHLSRSLPSNRFFCKCLDRREAMDMAKYRESFSKRMAMAGLKPHHQIAMGVSGGPDSMALCVLTAGWKTDALIGTDETTGCIDGLLAIVVDHGLRAESKDEANCVHDRVSNMGIRCEIVHYDWLDGRPKQGHLQEAAREMRYQNFQNVCIQHQIGVLLIAHHADDQAELFILRLSRSSGVLGLAGMAFTTQLFPIHYVGNSSSHGILVVRPLLEFSKEDMYRICEGGNQEWVEDPTNQSSLFARNRIRMSLRNLPCISKSELQDVIFACRKTRSYVDQICYNLINKAVTVMDYGCAIIELEKLIPSNVEDICLSKFVALILQFISQRHRPVRGRTSQLILDYIRSSPCKTSLTAAGCYLCAAPGSEGTKILVCCSLDSPQPSKLELSHRFSYDGCKHCKPNEIEQIIMDGKSYSDYMVPAALDVPFLNVTSSESILTKALRLNILSESTHRSILLLQRDETKYFKGKTEVISERELRKDLKSVTTLSEPLQSGQFFHFMNRFLVTWRLLQKGTSSVEDYHCKSCLIGHDTVPTVRPMIDADWLYLASLSKGQITDECEQHRSSSGSMMDQRTKKKNFCPYFVRLSAQRALRSLKSIPVSARRGLPVLVNSQGLLLSIPSVCFNHCPYLMVSAVFKPRVPLGGGHSSFV